MRSILDLIEVLDTLEDPIFSLTFQTWTFHASGHSNSCHKCTSKDGHVYKVLDSADLLQVFPYGVFVSDDTFACNIHPHCDCYLTKTENND